MRDLSMLKKFTDKLPKKLYLDSSVLINSIITTSKFYEECSKLLEKIKEKNIECFTASLSLDEIWYILIKTVVEDEKNNFLIDEYKKNPKSILSAKNIVERVTFNLLMGTNFKIVDIDIETMLYAKDFLWIYLLLPRDAIHLAIAYKYGISDIVTTNPDFKNASDDFNIYLVE